MRKLFAISLLLFGGLAQSESLPEKWTLLIHGEYHGDEAPANPGKQWLALTAIEGEWHLVPANVKAQRVYDPVLDDEGQKTGIKITSEHTEAIALIRS